MSAASPATPATSPPRALPAARPARPAAPPLPALDALDRTHREMLAMLDEFARLLAHVDDHGPGEAARQIAQRLHAFFDQTAQAHHAQEEQHVFPALLSGPDSTLSVQVRRLQQDHGWLEEDWRLLAPQLEGIARGYNWADLPMLRQALPVFAELYREHIALEESMVYPAARQRLRTLADGAAARRGSDLPDDED